MGMRDGIAPHVPSVFSVNANTAIACNASGDVNIRVTKQPEHGTVETITATNFPAFPKENIRARCNNHKVRGVQVNYKSAEKYVGDDTLDLLVLFPGAFGGEVHLNINVR